jgi:hypothetical protein
MYVQVEGLLKTMRLWEKVQRLVGLDLSRWRLSWLCEENPLDNQTFVTRYTLRSP